MNVTEEQYHARRAEFPDQIQILARHSEVVNRVILEYATGRIVTKEEAMCEMVLGLNRQRESLQESFLYQMNPIVLKT